MRCKTSVSICTAYVRSNFRRIMSLGIGHSDKSALCEKNKIKKKTKTKTKNFFLDLNEKCQKKILMREVFDFHMPFLITQVPFCQTKLPFYSKNYIKLFKLNYFVLSNLLIFHIFFFWNVFITYFTNLLFYNIRHFFCFFCLIGIHSMQG